MQSGQYCVYYWKDDETIVYIGKGCGRRMLDPWRSEELMARSLDLKKMRKDFSRRICAVCDDEGAASRLESWMINRMGRRHLGTGPLCNRRSGKNIDNMAATLTREDGTVIERPPNKLLIWALKVAAVVILILVVKSCLG
jgi:hypothetical protein